MRSEPGTLYLVKKTCTPDELKILQAVEQLGFGVLRSGVRVEGLSTPALAIG